MNLRTTLAPTQHAWLRALAKAQALHVVPRQLGNGFYLVRGGGTLYTVRRLDRDSEHYACNCPAGLRGKVCYHQAAVANLPYERAGRAAYRRRLAHQCHQAAKHLTPEHRPPSRVLSSLGPGSLGCFRRCCTDHSGWHI